MNKVTLAFVGFPRFSGCAHSAEAPRITGCMVPVCETVAKEMKDDRIDGEGGDVFARRHVAPTLGGSVKEIANRRVAVVWMAGWLR
jgi:hypothetical protein